MKGRSILITGGSGFLAQALIQRLYKDNKVVAMARNEGNLLAIKQKFPSIHILPGDVSQVCDVEEALQGIDGVFHLAGYKHVTLAEDNVHQCVKTNVHGTVNLLERIALHHKAVEFVVGTSTDKAAQVSGIYGASKLTMEGLFRQFQALTDTKLRIVRYGNVLYSTGSVLCRWKEALQTGRPITISDPDATRFYWTVDAAVDLLFECLTHATGPEPYVPTMKAMRLGDILMAMEEKYGKAVDVVTTGLKPSENVHERMKVEGPSSNEVPLYTRDEIFELI